MSTDVVFAATFACDCFIVENSEVNSVWQEAKSVISEHFSREVLNIYP